LPVGGFDESIQYRIAEDLPPGAVLGRRRIDPGIVFFDPLLGHLGLGFDEVRPYLGAAAGQQRGGQHADDG
jgi:hypothetical protein